MTADIGALIDSNTIIKYVKTQYKNIKKNKHCVNTDKILNKLAQSLGEKGYNVINHTTIEVSIKIDKKKNVDDIRKEIIKIITDSVTSNIDVGFLFKFIRHNNEFIVRTKRNI